eukprot:12744023-Ditylum_brightwellii.AAC.1
MSVLWYLYYDCNDATVYVESNNQWTKHKILRKTRKSLEFCRSGIITTAPKKLTPVTDVTTSASG